MATQEGIKQYADFLADNMPTGMVIGRFPHDDSILFHPDLNQLQTYIEQQLETDLKENVSDAQAEDRPKLRTERIETANNALQFFQENKDDILANLAETVRAYLSIEHSDLTFPDPRSESTGISYRMVPPWDHHHRADNAELYTDQLIEKRAWTAMTEMLEHYGASVVIIPSYQIDGNHDIWTRDPALMINEGGNPIAYISNTDVINAPLKEKSVSINSYKAYLEKQGVEVREVDAEIEGGNILLDPQRNVILYTTNSESLPILAQEMTEALEGLETARNYIAKETPSNLELYDIWLEGLKDVVANGSYEEANDYIALGIADLGIVPEDFPIEVDGRSYESISFYTKQNAYKYEQAYSSRQNKLDQLNGQADRLQATTGIPVIPITRVNTDLYHLDTFASVIVNEQTQESYLLIHPNGTDSETMERLQQIYGDNIIQLNDQDISDMGPNLVQLGSTIITNDFSAETRATLNTLGFNVRGHADVGLDYNLSYDDANTGIFNQYIGSGVHCLTDEVEGITMSKNEQPDGPETPFHAGM